MHRITEQLWEEGMAIEDEHLAKLSSLPGAKRNPIVTFQEGGLNRVSVVSGDGGEGRTKASFL
jgi:hypothetical protein